MNRVWIAVSSNITAFPVDNGFKSSDVCIIFILLHDTSIPNYEGIILTTGGIRATLSSPGNCKSRLVEKSSERGVASRAHCGYRKRYEKSEVEVLVWRRSDGVDSRMCPRG